MVAALTKILIFMGGIYLLLLVGLYLGQRRLIYVPNPDRVAPVAVGLSGVREVEFTPETGVQVLGWYAPAKANNPTILYFHGNGGNLAGRSDRIKFFQNAGLGVLVMSYRSYSGSTGLPSERANISDAVHVYDWLMGQGVGSRNIVLFGESLGTGVATQIAALKEIGGLILDAPYTSLVDIAQYGYPYFPVRPLLKDRYPSVGFIKRIDAPLLIIHGQLDQVIPVHFGRSLFDAAIEPKKIVVFPKGGHTDLFDHGAMQEIRLFMQSLRN